MPSLSDIIARFRIQPHTRLLAFGSSNTEHFLSGMHWFDYLELAINATYGHVHTCINAGVGGDTAGKMLARFDRDAALYQPHLTPRFWEEALKIQSLMDDLEAKTATANLPSKRNP